MSGTAQFPKEQSPGGAFERQGDAFRQWVRADGSSPYPAVTGRYHLYVSLACPWAHRTVIVRKVRGLAGAIGMTVVDPFREDDEGWAFREVPGASADPIEGFRTLREAYLASDQAYDDRVTVPVLWDAVTHRIVSNSDDDIMRMFELEFDAVATIAYDFCPAALRAAIDELNERIYVALNDGVYQAGFATSQHAYETGARRVFAMLDELDMRLADRRYLFGDAPVETDVRLFVTLVRFDAVYYSHFKCNVRRITDYANLSGYLRDLYQWRGVGETVNFEHIKRHYYATHPEINPTRIVPIGPVLDLASPYARARLAAR